MFILQKELSLECATADLNFVLLVSEFKTAALCEDTYSTQNLDWSSLAQKVAKKANQNSC